MAGQSVPKTTAIQLILNFGRAGCANKTAIQVYICVKKGRAGCRKTTAIQFILKNGRAGCANKTAIQCVCLAHYFPLFWRDFKFLCFLF